MKTRAARKAVSYRKDLPVNSSHINRAIGLAHLVGIAHAAPPPTPAAKPRGAGKAIARPKRLKPKAKARALDFSHLQASTPSPMTGATGNGNAYAKKAAAGATIADAMAELNAQGHLKAKPPASDRHGWDQHMQSAMKGR